MRDLRLTSPFAGPMSPDDAAPLTQVMKALASPSRLQIIAFLATHNEVAVGELTGLLDSSLCQPTVSHHLHVLAAAGLVRWEKRGTNVYYRLDRDGLAAVGRALTPGGAS
jgi:ArsR family transcriptional regulator